MAHIDPPSTDGDATTLSLPLPDGTATAAAAQDAPPAMVMIVRHAEKPKGSKKPFGVTGAGKRDSECLTTTGWARSGALVALFAPPHDAAPRTGIRRPDRLFAADPLHTSARSVDTLTALSDRMGSPITTTWAKGDEAALATHLSGLSGVSLVAWEHKHIQALAEALGRIEPAVPAWPSDRFDLVWTFTRDGDGWTFRQVPQLLLAGDLPTV